MTFIYIRARGQIHVKWDFYPALTANYSVRKGQNTLSGPFWKSFGWRCLSKSYIWNPSCTTSLRARTHTHQLGQQASLYLQSHQVHPHPPWILGSEAASLWRCELKMFLPAPLMSLAFLFYLSFIVLGARSLVRVVSSVHLRGSLWAERLALDPFKCFSCWPLSVSFSFFKRVSRHPRLVENHRPASSEQQESCVWRIHEPHTSSESARSIKGDWRLRAFHPSLHPSIHFRLYLDIWCLFLSTRCIFCPKLWNPTRNLLATVPYTANTLLKLRAGRERSSPSTPYSLLTMIIYRYFNLFSGAVYSHLLQKQ